MKPTGFGFLIGTWRSDRFIKGIFSHALSTPREVLDFVPPTARPGLELQNQFVKPSNVRSVKNPNQETKSFFT
jgi:hypothetical protein